MSEIEPQSVSLRFQEHFVILQSYLTKLSSEISVKVPTSFIIFSNCLGVAPNESSSNGTNWTLTFQVISNYL